MALTSVYIPDVAWAQEAQGTVPEWVVDDGEGEVPDEFWAQAEIPSTYNMHDEGVVTPVKSQGDWGMCWTFGAISAVETTILTSTGYTYQQTVDEGQPLDLSERHLAYFAYHPITEEMNPTQAGEGIHLLSDNPNAAFNVGGGGILVTTLFSQGIGLVPESEFPYWGKEELTNLQYFDAHPDEVTREQIETEAKASGYPDGDTYLANLAERSGKSEDEIFAAFKVAERANLEKNLSYSSKDDWSIDNTRENRMLSGGFLLKNGNVLPGYWTNAAEDVEPSADGMRAIKQEILDGRAVSMSYFVDQSGEHEVSTEDGGDRYAYYYNVPSDTNHRVCIVGWDDSFSRENFQVTDDKGTHGFIPPKDGAWIVKNSWGSITDAEPDANGNVVNRGEFGIKNENGEDTGYFYLSYYDKSLSKTETMEFTSAPGDEFITMQYDYMPAITGFYKTAPSEQYVSSANVFTTEGGFELQSVSTRTSEQNQRVTFAIYRLKENAKNPTDGTFLGSVSQNFEYSGFHRIELTHPLTFAKGESFSIVSTASKLTEGGKRVYDVSANSGIPEGEDNGRYYTVAVVNEGESYFGTGSTKQDYVWQDWAQFLAENAEGMTVDNFSIKAYGVPVEDPELSVSYNAHCQTYGWDAPSGTNGTTAGTTGESKRLEAFTATVGGANIAYRSHVQGIGWESEWAHDGVPSGTTGEGRRLEAIQMNLEGAAAETHDVWYRVHAQTFGWLGWAKAGEPAGTAGMSKRLEAFEVIVLPKDQVPEDYDETLPAYRSRVTGQAHVQGIGWQETASADVFGTEGQSKRVEALKLELKNQPWAGGIAYEAHVQNIGWQGEVADGALAGTTGESKRVEAVRIHLTGEASEHLSVWYRVHSQTFGWLDWACDGADAGTVGLSKRAEAMEIIILPKDVAAPGPTDNPVQTS